MAFSALDIHFHKELPAGFMIVEALATPAALAIGQSVHNLDKGQKGFKAPEWARLVILTAMVLLPVFGFITVVALIIKFAMSKHLDEKSMVDKINDNRVPDQYSQGGAGDNPLTRAAAVAAGAFTQ